jgi:tRNA(Ile)-lysidine synthase TilS/MesJ
MVELSKKLLRIVGRTNAKYNLMEEGDKVLLGLSGG